ncbi:MAG: NADH-quinone oxidoreductase subunit NuoH [Haliangiales bacterium]
MDTLFAIIDWPGTKWLLLVFLFVMPVASLLTWAERRQSAMMQDRLGPNRANIGPIRIWGILHFVADAVKMIKKEDFIPANAHKQLFSLAPVLALAPVLIAFAIIPFGPDIYPQYFGSALPWSPITGQVDGEPAITLQMLSIEFGLLFYFAILSIANFGATIAGWASYNKWALLGGLRSSSQMMSYEVAMGLSLMGIFLVMGTLEPGAMVDWQAQHTWGIVYQPVALVLFFTAAIAETKRGPFDLPEGEPEIIGYFVEYSGIRWGMFFLAEFIEIVFISMVMSTIFLGGYHIPFLDPDGVFRAFGLESSFQLQHQVVVVLQLLAFGVKTVLFCSLQLAIRWTLPRFRADQLMDLGWKKLLPLALANLMVTALVLLIFM